MLEYAVVLSFLLTGSGAAVEGPYGASGARTAIPHDGVIPTDRHLRDIGDVAIGRVPTPCDGIAAASRPCGFRFSDPMGF